MSKSPASPPFVKKRQRYSNSHQSTEDLYHEIKSKVKDAIDASRQQNTRSLYHDYVKIGEALGIDEVCTDFIENYAKFLSRLLTSRERQSFSNAKVMFQKDPENLAGMVANINLDDKLEHVKQFLRRCQIPDYVINTLHVPERIGDSDMLDEMVCENVDRQIKIHKKCIPHASCQNSLDYSMLNLDGACQTVMEVKTNKEDGVVSRRSRMKVEKKQLAKYPAEDLNSLALRKTKSDDTKDNPVQFTEWYQPKLITFDDDRMPGGGPMRVGEESNSKRAAPYKTNSKKKNSVHRRTFNTEITRLVIRDLCPEDDALDIDESFCNFEFLECSKLKYDRDTGKSLGIGIVAFSNRDAATNVLNFFRLDPRSRLNIILPMDQSWTGDYNY